MSASFSRRSARFGFPSRLAHLRAALATLLTALALLLPGQAGAHSLDAAYAVIYVPPDNKTFSLRIDMNLEALLAGVDFALANTNESPNAPEYNRLRRLSPDELRDEFANFRQEFYAGIHIQFDDAEVPFTVRDEIFADVGDLSKPRMTGIQLDGEIPEGAQTVSFGWSRDFGAIVFRTVGARTRIVHIQRLSPGTRSETLSLADIKARKRWEMVKDFIAIGYEHIVPKGLDHILFVVGLFLLSIKLRPILTQVTTFTVAHTVTLGLGAADIINLSPNIVAPLIAASIVYVGVENIFLDRLSIWRPFLVFGFGLLHGLGFAGVLRDFNLPTDDFLFGLLSFNVGVELGQLTVIGVCFLAVGFWFGNKPWYHKFIVIPGSATIALVAAYWFLQRTIL